MTKYVQISAFLQRQMLNLAHYLETSDDEDKEIKAANELKKSVTESTDACLSSCKWMYFCTLPDEHQGPHSEGGMLWWTEEESDQCP